MARRTGKWKITDSSGHQRAATCAESGQVAPSLHIGTTNPGALSRRCDPYWGTTMGRWIHTFGVTNLSPIVRVTPRGIYDWLSGDSRPRWDTAMEMVRLSEGALTLEDIYRHREEMAHDSVSRPAAAAP